MGREAKRVTKPPIHDLEAYENKEKNLQTHLNGPKWEGNKKKKKLLFEESGMELRKLVKEKIGKFVKDRGKYFARGF